MTAKDANVTIAESPPDVLHVSMVDAVHELPKKLYVVNTLEPR